MSDVNPSDACPRASHRGFRGFARYTRWYLKRNFAAVRLLTEAAPPVDFNDASAGPIVVYLNHPSWWDPMIGVLVADRFARDRGHAVPIDAKALESYGFFKKLGFFGVEVDHPRGGAQFLRTALRVVAHDDMALWVTAEGQFTDVRQRPVTLMPGLAHLAARMPRGRIVPMAVEYPFWNEKQPEVLVAFGEPMEATRSDDHDAWQSRLDGTLASTLDRLQTASIARDPQAFTPLVAGKTGVGGVYDFWRGTKARLTGKKFDASHASASGKPSGKTVDRP